MRIVERHFYNKSGNDEAYFVRLFGAARRFHKHGHALDTQAELVNTVSGAFWEFMHKCRRDSLLTGAEARRLFWQRICKVRCMTNDHGATVGGYIVLHGELKALWCDVPGEGAYLVQAAIADGAVRLSCFDGYLVWLYSQFGFKVVRREDNHTWGEPAVFWMERVAECRSPHCECDEAQRAHCSAKLEDRQRSRHV